tara:strand:- start:438 stop:1397 length:960 start_codon:yes stop_codon:yes gene_type:complete
MDNEKMPDFYYCEKCDFKCIKKSNYEAHLLTRKHNYGNNDNKKMPKNAAAIYICNLCNKEYKFASGLSRHKKKCFENSELCEPIIKENIINNNIINNNIVNSLSKDMIVDLIKENSEIKELICKQSEKIEEQNKQITQLLPKINNTTNINNHITNNANVKQKFNINIFLNEHCKDALNMNEFINQIEVSLDQLDITKSKGLAEGLSNVLIESISKLSLYERPLHCTDIKRETLYIKNNNSWEKDSNKTKIKKAIKDASNKQYKTLQQWTQENPDLDKNDKKQEYFAKTISAIGKDSNKIEDKVIKKICSNTYLKESFDE